MLCKPPAGNPLRTNRREKYPPARIRTDSDLRAGIHVKVRVFLFVLAALLCIAQIFPRQAQAFDTEPETVNRLSISTTDSRSIAIDRLLYVAFRDIGWRADFVADPLSQGYAFANENTRNGTIAATPEMEKLYPRLVKVPVVIEENHIEAYVRKDSGLHVDSWADLGGLRVGILPQRVHISRSLPQNIRYLAQKETSSLLYEGLINNEYDVVVLSAREHESQNMPEGVFRAGRIETLPEYLYLNENYAHIIPKITESLNTLLADGRGENILNDIPVPGMFQKKTVVHIISSNSEIPREEQFSNALRDSFSDDETVEWYSVALNSKRFAWATSRLAYILSLLRQDCVSRGISAIVVSGDDALKFIKENYMILFRNVPVIYYGVTDSEPEQGYEDFFTGINESIPAADTVEAAINLFPDTENIYVINDYTTEGIGYRESIQKELESFKDKHNIIYNLNAKMEEFLSTLKAIPENSILVIGSFFCDASGQYYSQAETKRLIESVCSAPVFTLYSSNLPYGALGGKCPDYVLCGEAAADMLKSLLNGVKVADLPPISDTARLSRWVFDNTKLIKFEIAGSELPLGSTVINKEPSIWVTNPSFASSMGALLVLTVLVIIGLLVFLNSFRKQNEELKEARKHLHSAEEMLEKDAKLKEVKERLESVINPAPVLYMLLVSGRCVEMNEHMKKVGVINIGDDTRSVYELRKHYDEIKERILREGLIVNEVINFRIKNGEIHRFLVNMATVDYEDERAVSVWAIDIETDELKKDQLNAARQSLQTMLDTMPVAIVITDAKNHDLIYCNNDGIKMLDLNELEDAKKLSLSDIFAEKQSDGMDAMDLAGYLIGAEHTVVMGVQIKTSKGKAKDVRIRSSNIDYYGNTSKILIMTDLTREKELQKMQLNLQTILDTLPIPVRISDLRSKSVIYANNACVELFRCGSPEKMYGMRVIDTMPKTQSDGTTSADLMKRVHSKAVSGAEEIEYVTFDGKIIETEVLNCPTNYMGRESSLGIIRDLAVEKEYQRMQLYLQTVLDFLPIPVRIYDTRTKNIVYVNKGFCDLLGFGSAEEIKGLPADEFIVSAEAQENILNRHKNTGFSSAECICRKTNGGTFNARVTDCVIEYKGAPSSLGIVQDLTAEKEYEQMLLNAAEKEKEANQMKSRFLVNMSHEIRTPMNAIIGLTEIELRKKPPKETKEVYKKVNTSAKDLLQIINDILDLSKIEADKMELFLDEFELEEVLNSAMLVATPHLDGKNVEMILQASMELPQFIIGDRTRLWQVLKNFLDNSAKFTETGKIVLTVSMIEDKSNDETVTISFVVEDTGIGMSEQQLEAVFMPYEQFYSDAQKRYSGTGLGMPISKQMCELMGGGMEIASARGKGTRIEAVIPFKRAKNTETQLQAVRTPLLKGLNILVVDDNSLSLEIMAGLLRCNDVDPVLARNGREAMQTIFEYRDLNVFFDIILLDYMMEGLSGLETARQIHMGLSKSPKLLMVTAYQKQLLKKELEANGIDEIIEKPFIPTQFIKKLCETLGVSEKEDFAVRNDTFTIFNDANVLIVEDNRLNQEVATGMCKYFGISPLCANDGKHAIEVLNEVDSFDLIFMDLKMPIMDGYEATRAIRADGRWNDVPIISLTADAMIEVVDRCMEAGMNDHLTKPIEIDKLHAALLKWLPAEKRDTKAEVKIKKLPHPADEETRERNEALIRFQGDEKLYKKALLEFAASLPKRWRSFNKAVEEKEETLKYVHNLKGVAGNLSEMEIYQGASKFESSLRNNAPSKELYERLVNASLEAKNRIVRSYGGIASALIEDGTAAEFADILLTLEEGLVNFNPVLCSEMAERLGAKKWPFADDIKINKIIELSESYQFDEALSILQTLKGGIYE